MKSELEELHGRLAALPKQGRKRMYTTDLKRRVLEYCEARVASGATESTACGELGVDQSTVSVWRRGRRGGTKGRNGCVRAVELEQQPSRVSPTLVVGSVRVEGLSLAELIEAARALR